MNRPPIPNLIDSPRIRRLVHATKFAMAGGTGLVVNAALLWIAVTVAHLNYLPGAVLATQGSTTWNFALNELWVFRGRKSGSPLKRYLGFSSINNIALLLRLPIIAGLTQGLGLHYLLSNLVSLFLLFAARFLIADGLIWKTSPPTDLTVAVGSCTVDLQPAP